MRRVRLEKTCETKNAQTERSGRRIASKRLRAGREVCSPGLRFGVWRQTFGGSIEHVVQSSRVDRGQFTAA